MRPGIPQVSGGNSFLSNAAAAAPEDEAPRARFLILLRKLKVSVDKKCEIGINCQRERTAYILLQELSLGHLEYLVRCELLLCTTRGCLSDPFLHSLPQKREELTMLGELGIDFVVSEINVN